MTVTVQQVIDTIKMGVKTSLADPTHLPGDQTVDTLKTGQPDQPVTGIVTTFTATRRVIEQAKALGANFIITHEPTFFNHHDEVEWLVEDPVYQSKRAALDESGIAVWRFHDFWHTHQPDGILVGLVEQLGWKAYQDDPNEIFFTLPATSLRDLVRSLKSTFNLPAVRFTGDPEMVIQKVAFMMGSVGGEWQIEVFQKVKPEVMICGETVEWQVAEYVRDSAAAGLKRALVVLGHEPSEEAGMAYLVDWLSPRLPGVKITHIPAGDPMQYI